MVTDLSKNIAQNFGHKNKFNKCNKKFNLYNGQIYFTD